MTPTFAPANKSATQVLRHATDANVMLPRLLIVLLVFGLHPSFGQTTYTPYSFTTIAGLAGGSGWADGVGIDARFSRPEGVAVDKAGNVYIADSINFTVRKITPDQVVSTLAGQAMAFGTNDGQEPASVDLRRCKSGGTQGVEAGFRRRRTSRARK